MTLPVELGPRAAEVMRFVWSQKAPVQALEICNVMQDRHDIAYTTVMTTLNRLVQNGMLQRHKFGVYTPTCSAETFLEQAVDQLIAQVGLGEQDTNTSTELAPGRAERDRQFQRRRDQDLRSRRVLAARANA